MVYGIVVAHQQWRRQDRAGDGQCTDETLIDFPGKAGSIDYVLYTYTDLCTKRHV